jgi:PAS domain S-box-containing protein/diguanylate cyclase (GGDEF)-like protein
MPIPEFSPAPSASDGDSPQPDLDASVIDPAQFLGKIMDCATNAIAAFDLEGHYIFANDRACELTGYSQEELRERSAEDMMPIRFDDPAVVAFQQTLLRGEPVERFDTEIIRKDGTKRQITFSLRPLLAPDGQIVGVVGSAEDITDRRRDQVLIEAHRRLLQDLARTAPIEDHLRTIAATMDEIRPRQTVISMVAGDPPVISTSTSATVHPDIVEALSLIPVSGDAVGPGLAACSRAIVLCSDVREDPAWQPYRATFEAHGICSVWAVPILSDGGELIGTITTLGAQPALPDDWHGRLLDMACQLAGLAITRHRAAESARDTQEQYQRLWQTSTDAIVLIDEHSRIIDASPATAKIFGYQPDELQGKHLAILQPERLREPHRRGMARLIESGSRSFDWSSVHTTALHRDGHEFPIDMSFSDLSTNGTRRFAAYIRDASARIQAEQALRESEARYRTLAENALDMVCELGSDGRFVYVSPNFKTILGYEPSHLIGQSPFTYIHSEDRQRVAEQFSNLVGAEGEPGSSEFRYQRADGTWCWLQVSANLFTTPDGTQHAVIVARDIEERRQMEDALHEGQERLRSFVENAPVIIFATDLDGVFTLYEGKELQRYGQKPGQFIGRRILDVYDNNPALASNLQRTLSGETFSDVVTIGSVHLDIHHAPIRDESGAVTGMIGILTDVTARARAEALVAAQRRVLEMIAVGTGIDVLFNEIAIAVEANAPGVICTILTLDDDGVTIHPAAGPSLPDEFHQAIDGARIGPKAGSCGTAAYLGETVIVTDIEHDPLWEDFKDLALPLGLRACWSTPVLATTGAVVATLALYYRDTRGPLDRERDLVDVFTHLTSIAIERQRADAALKSRSEELERMYGRLMSTHADLEESKHRLEEKSQLLEAALEAERERSRRDQLTGALNHAAITDMVRDVVELKSAIPHAIVMVDVDGLKVANDTYGHQVGDAVLIKVAEVLARPGASVGRYGGDEFVVVLPGADRDAAELYRGEVLEAFGSAGLTDPLTGARVPVVVSMGIAIYPEEGDSVEDLIRLSDSAMYQSRRHRPSAEGALSRPLGGDRAARMVGELVPLLTSPANLQDKLRLVAHRLSVGAGYDAVNFVLHDDGAIGMASSSFARVPEQFLESWNNRSRSTQNLEIARILERTRRPLILDDLQLDERLDEEERSILASVGLRSALCAPMIWENTLIGILTVASTRQGAFSVRDAEFVAAVATQVTAIVRMSTLLDQLRISTGQLLQSHESTVLMLASAAEAHDATTGRHLARVRQITAALATELGYDDDAARALGMAATLHDIGKIRVPDSVLGSAKSLADAEWILMKQHTIWGGAFLAGKPGFELAAVVARHHHERWDGGGYPDGLAGDAIPEAALITTVADSLDAMTSDRPYRRGRPMQEAIDEIVRCSGTQFSPRVVEALVRVHRSGALDFVERDAYHDSHLESDRAA